MGNLSEGSERRDSNIPFHLAAKPMDGQAGGWWSEHSHELSSGSSDSYILPEESPREAKPTEKKLEALLGPALSSKLYKSI